MAGDAVAVHPLTDDARGASGLLGTVRLPGARAELRCGRLALPLGERGTGIVLGLLAHDGSALDKVERMLKRRGLRPGSRVVSALTPDSGAVHPFVEAVPSSGRPLEVRYAARSLTLNRRGASLVLTLLVAHPRRVRKAAEALGAEGKHQWAEGMIQPGPLHNEGVALARSVRAVSSRRSRRTPVARRDDGVDPGSRPGAR